MTDTIVDPADPIWWCTPCGKWRPMRSLGSVGPVCRVCGTGRIRPPARGESVPLAPLPDAVVRAELDR